MTFLGGGVYSLGEICSAGDIAFQRLLVSELNFPPIEYLIEEEEPRVENGMQGSSVLDSYHDFKRSMDSFSTWKTRAMR